MYIYIFVLLRQPTPVPEVAAQHKRRIDLPRCVFFFVCVCVCVSFFFLSCAQFFMPSSFCRSVSLFLPSSTAFDVGVFLFFFFTFCAFPPKNFYYQAIHHGFVFFWLVAFFTDRSCSIRPIKSTVYLVFYAAFSSDVTPGRFSRLFVVLRSVYGGVEFSSALVT